MAAFVLLLLALPGTTYANSTPAQSATGGTGLIVPVATSEVRIDHENLVFDFTASSSNPLVKARYDLKAIGQKDVALDAVFIAPGGQGLTLLLNGLPLEIAEASDLKLPSEWVAAKRGLDPRTGEDYQLGEYIPDFARSRGWTFHLQMPAGSVRTLEASYQANMGYDRSRADYVLRHMVYVLGPAKNWAGFGGLDVSVVVPSAYTLASDPVLPKLEENEGITHYGRTFEGIPSELLRLSTMRAPSPYLSYREGALFGVPLLISVAVGVLVGVFASRLTRWWLALVVAGAVAIFASVIVSSVGTILVTSIEPLASAADDHNGSNELLLILWMAMLSPMLSGLIAATWAMIGCIRRSRPRAVQ